MRNERTNVRAEFEEWWKRYPCRKGKIAAAREYEKARKLASAEELIAGVERYKRTKPAYADWCHPRTWLHQGRWMDEEDEREKPQDTRPITHAERERAHQVRRGWGRCLHDPECESSAACIAEIVRGWRLQEAS